VTFSLGLGLVIPQKVNYLVHGEKATSGSGGAQRQVNPIIPYPMMFLGQKLCEADTINPVQSTVLIRVVGMNTHEISYVFKLPENPE